MCQIYLPLGACMKSDKVQQKLWHTTPIPCKMPPTPMVSFLFYQPHTLWCSTCCHESYFWCEEKLKVTWLSSSFIRCWMVRVWMDCCLGHGDPLSTPTQLLTLTKVIWHAHTHTVTLLKAIAVYHWYPGHISHRDNVKSVRRTLECTHTHVYLPQCFVRRGSRSNKL